MNFHTNHRLLVAFAFFGYLLLTYIIAIGPALNVQNTPPLPGARIRTDSEERGRELYMVEGCGFCHTQFVRDLPMDSPYGRGSVAEDYALEDPPMPGTQRTGPDLSNVAQRQPSDVWHLIHLYNPRSVVPLSVMPGYPWYFEEKDSAAPDDVIVRLPDAYAPESGKIIVAKSEAMDLVAYLLSLRQVDIGL